MRDFEVSHEKRMHLIVVRRDGTGFQHLHPTLGADGTWSAPITLPDAGAYRVFADFKRDGARVHARVRSHGRRPGHLRAVPRAFDQHRDRRVHASSWTPRATTLAFAITRDGKPVETEPYLGAGGHLVALREGDLAFLHVHPTGDGVEFETELDKDSRYRLYLQFKHAGRVHTAEFTR